MPFRIGVAYCLYADWGGDDTSITCYQRAQGRSNRAMITTQLGGRVHLTRRPYHFRLALPASRYKAVSVFNTGDYRCGRYKNGVTCRVPGHVFFVTGTAISGH